jgi:ACDE family multidrug resistance protein
VLVALFAVLAAPRLKSRFGTARSPYVNVAVLAADLAVIGIWPGKPTGGDRCRCVLGVTNTLVTAAVMSMASVERPVASATCGFVRFIGGGPAPYAAARLVEHTNVHVLVLDWHPDDRGVFAVLAAAGSGAVAAGGAVPVSANFVVGFGEAEGVGVGE